jgi:hypothetical protein
MLKAQNANHNLASLSPRHRRQLKRVILQRLMRIVLAQGVARDLTRAIARIGTTRMPRAPTRRLLALSTPLVSPRPHRLRGRSLVFDRPRNCLGARQFIPPGAIVHSCSAAFFSGLRTVAAPPV